VGQAIRHRADHRRLADAGAPGQKKGDGVTLYGDWISTRSTPLATTTIERGANGGRAWAIGASTGANHG
jgi:hypothetical protein